jgi:hypothetical protein
MTFLLVAAEGGAVNTSLGDRGTIPLLLSVSKWKVSPIFVS